MANLSVAAGLLHHPRQGCRGEHRRRGHGRGAADASRRRCRQLVERHLHRESEGASRLDGILGLGDSGGSAWITAGGGWAIAGVNANGTGDTYGSQSYFARVAGVRDWLASTVPGLRFVS